MPPWAPRRHQQSGVVSRFQSYRKKDTFDAEAMSLGAMQLVTTAERPGGQAGYSSAGAACNLDQRDFDCAFKGNGAGDGSALVT